MSNHRLCLHPCFSSKHVLLVLYGWLVRCEASGRTKSCFVRGCFSDFFKITRKILVSFQSSFFSDPFIKVKRVKLFNSTDTATKNSRFILPERLEFHLVDNLSIAVYAFPMHMLTMLSVDDILLPRYVKWSRNFRGLF